MRLWKCPGKLWFHFLKRKEFFKDITLLALHFKQFLSFTQFENIMRQGREFVFTGDMLSVRQVCHMHHLT